MTKYTKKPGLLKNLYLAIIKLPIFSYIFLLPCASYANNVSSSFLEETLVTAQRHQQKITDVPISITAISGEELDNAGIQRFTDLAFAVPNLSVIENIAGQQTVLIRGVGNTIGSSSTVGLYLDEIPVSTTPFASLDLQVLDLERVEVLKGPQGTLYGQGSMGGTVRFITNDPSFDNVNGQLKLSTYGTQDGDESGELTGFINVPIISNTLALRVSGTYKDKGGWIDQPAASLEDINDTELSNIRIKALWQVSDKLSIMGSSIRHRRDDGGSVYVNTGSENSSNHRRAVFPTQSYTDSVHDYNLSNLTIDYDLDFATISSITSLIEQSIIVGERSSILDFPTGVEYLAVGTTTDINSLTQDLRLVSNSNSSVNWTLGIFYNDYTFEQDGNNFWALFPGGTPIDFGTFPAIRTSKSIAYYGDISYSVTDQLTLGLGTRSFEDDRTLVNNRVFNGVPNPEFGIPQNASFDKLSSRAYLSYATTENTNIYFNISEGFRSGGFNANGSQPAYEPETLVAYELGIKSSLADKKLYTSFAVFYSKYEDYITSTFDPATTSTINANVGEALIKGIEWGISWVISEGLTLGFNGAVMETAEFSNINSTRPDPLNIEGDSLPNIPAYGYSINIDYRFHWLTSIPGVFHLTYNRQGHASNINRSSTATAPIVAEVDSFGFFDTRLSAQFNSASISLFAKNLLDEDALISPNRFQMSSQLRPRVVGINVAYDF